MAKDGFKVMDSDMHIIEPWDLWLQYIEPEFKDRAPRGLGEYFLDLGLEVDGRVVCQWRTPVNNEARVRFEENLNRKNQRVSDYEDAYERALMQFPRSTPWTGRASMWPCSSPLWGSPPLRWNTKTTGWPPRWLGPTTTGWRTSVGRSPAVSTARP